MGVTTASYTNRVIGKNQFQLKDDSMKVKDAIKHLSQMDQEAEFVGEDCEPVCSFYSFTKDEQVLVSTSTIKQLTQAFAEIEGHDVA